MGVLSHKVPAVVKGFGTGVVVHKHLVQGLQRQIAVVLLRCGAVGVRPVLGDEGVQNTGLDHLGFDLVAVLDEGHGKGAGVLQRIGGQLIEDFVVLGLLPFKLQGIAGINGLQILHKQGEGGGAPAGVAHAVELLAVGLFNGLLSQLLQSHALGFLDDLLGGRQLSGAVGRGGSGAPRLGGSAPTAAAGGQGQSKGSGEQQCKCAFHNRSSFVILHKTKPVGGGSASKIIVSAFPLKE